jgi:hypothetical protein
METLQQDIRFGVRTLFKKLGFSTAVILALALGIGANTAIFSVTNAVILNASANPKWSIPPFSPMRAVV